LNQVGIPSVTIEKFFQILDVLTYLDVEISQCFSALVENLTSMCAALMKRTERKTSSIENVLTNSMKEIIQECKKIGYTQMKDIRVNSVEEFDKFILPLFKNLQESKEMNRDKFRKDIEELKKKMCQT